MHKIATLVGFAVTWILICGNDVVQGDQWQCNGDLLGLINECSSYVQRNGPRWDPSDSCCRQLRTFRDPTCLCNYVTESVQLVIDMSKVVYVASFCGHPFRSGTRCGSYIVPSS